MPEKSFHAGRIVAAILAMAGLTAVFYQMVADNMPKGEVRTIEGYKPWSEETLAIAEQIPLQDGGRIKPLATYAGFTMLSLHGARSMKIASGPAAEHKIKPTEWLLDAIFRPSVAIHQPTFRVDNSAALEAIGVKPKGRRDRYSYSDLHPGREKLGQLSETYRRIEAKKRDPMQTQVIDLASNMQIYESLLGYFTFARNGVTLTGSGSEDKPDQRADVSAILTVAPMIQSEIQAAGSPSERLQDLLQQILDAANYSKFGLFLVPPTDRGTPTWLSAGNVIMETMTRPDVDRETYVGDIKALESAARSAPNDDADFRKALTAVRDRFAARAASRNEGSRVALEASYYHRNWFLHALVWFLLGSIAAFGMWSFGGGRAATLCKWATLAATSAGLIQCIIAIVKRCVIMQRPPVGNLYDTIIFIATSVVLIALIVEWINRRQFALGLAPIIGTGLILLARRFELGDAKDHMDPLVAVLDSNFWLTTHVITITLGYSAGLLSAFLSAAYIVSLGLGLGGGNADFRRQLTRTVYGMLCFTLFLSLVGTVLGGIWANYSWGRFWGWDPKENGALLIVLWTLAILHARLGGLIREWGIHLASLFTAIVVTFSWWHVNFLGVGLHNYGFTAGKNTIWTFYAVITLLLGAGFIIRGLDARRAQP